MAQIRINFDSPTKTYHPGQVIRLEVTLEVQETFTARRIFASFIGNCETFWTTTESYRDDNGRKQCRYVNCTGKEEYLRHKIDLAGSAEGALFEVEPGGHTYLGEFQLPAALPSSYEHELGWIRYSVEIHMDPYHEIESRFYESFRIFSPLDLIRFPHLGQPLKKEKFKSLGCCCKSDPVTVVLNLPKSGFVQDSPIPIALEISNDSNVEIPRVKLKIMQKLAFHVHDPVPDTRKKENTISKLRIDVNVKAYQKKVFNVEMWISNDHHVINMINSNLIDNRYILHANVLFYSCDLDLEMETEITLGAIDFPLNGVAYHLPMNVSERNVIRNESGSAVITEQPLPSYEQVVKTDGGQGITYLDARKQKVVTKDQAFTFFDISAPPTFEESQRTWQTSSDS